MLDSTLPDDSPLHHHMTALLEKRGEGNTLEFYSNHGDLFSLIHSPQFRAFFSKNCTEDDNYACIEDWVCTFQTSSTGLQYSMTGLRKRTNIPFLLFIDQIRHACILEIEQQLFKACLTSTLPGEGVLLIYPECITVCYISQYKITDQAVNVSISHRIMSPKALLSLEEAASIEDMKGRNIAKAFIQSGHKTIFHCGTLTHVDRQAESGVFGPTIDTLILASLASSHVRRECPKTALEIGIGSGHILSCISASVKNSLEIIGVDIQSQAVSCTERNLRRISSRVRPAISHFICVGPFDRTLFNRKFDLVISNPPYITSLKKNNRNIRRIIHENATTNSDIIRNMFESVPVLLTDRGAALFMLSSTTVGWRDFVPEGYTATDALPAEGIRVPFEVENVLDDPQWLADLVRQNAVEKDGHTYYHRLCPVWLRRA